MRGLRYDSLAQMPEGMRRQVAGKLHAGRIRPPAVSDPGKTNKYHNSKTELNGIVFDSRKEARRFEQLMEALEQGVISDLRLQQDFTLQESYVTAQGERIRAIRYRADFTYKVAWDGSWMPDGIGEDDLVFWRGVVRCRGRNSVVIEDVKSRGTRTKEYKLKRKLMADRGNPIREV